MGLQGEQVTATQHDGINHIYIDNILKKKCQTSTYTLYNWLECPLLLYKFCTLLNYFVELYTG